MSELLSVKNLKKYFPVRDGLLSRKKLFSKAVDDVSFSIAKGETLGLVGESGCGKTTVGRCILKLYPITSGEVEYDGNNITHLNYKDMIPYRKRMQMIFQDPFASLDPRMTVGEIVGAPLTVHKLLQGAERQKRIKELIDLVGLKADHINRYPHEFSGGQRQRIGIARSLAVEPEFIICDEPVSALDVSIQAQIINFLVELQKGMGLTYLFISHDLSLVRYISDKVGVMYLGNLVEYAGVHTIFADMKHPYTKALFSAAPRATPKAARESKREVLQGDIPSSINPPSGCAFRTRCPEVKAVCAREKPRLKDIGDSHLVACHHY